MRILAINLEIGMGHPNYLDYVLQAIPNVTPQIEINYYDILTQEPWFAKQFWQLSKTLYKIGAQGGIFTRLYNKLRNFNKNPRFLIYGIKPEQYDLILVSHPILARSLNDKVWYIHGEIAVPKECIVTNVEKIIVPISQTKEKFITYGIKPEKIFTSGLIISEDLIANAQLNQSRRLARLRSKKPLTIGFFLSGAYPKPHIDKIIKGINSVTKENNRAIVFLGLDYKKGKDFLTRLNQERLKDNNLKSSILFIQGKNRQEYQKRVNRLLPLLDAFVAPSHEHINWAIGLGIPMFVLFPMIGSYAEENFQFAEKQGVAVPLRTIADAQNLGKTIQELRFKKVLSKMAKNGFGKFTIDGAIKIAEQLKSLL